MRPCRVPLLLLALLLTACPRGPAGPDRSTVRPQVERPAPVPFRSGVLVVWQSGQAIGQERFEDDGNLANSLFALGGVEGRVRIWRDSGLVRVEIGERRIEREMTDAAIVLENGHWHVYAILAERFAGAREPKEVTVIVPSQDASLPGTVRVTPSEDGGRTVRVALAGHEVRAEIRRDGSVGRVSVPAQGIEVRRREDGPPPAPEPPRATRPAVSETEFTVRREGIELAGVLWTPTEGAPWPVAVIIAGSGPTDRDGNSATGLRTDAYRMLAEALVAEGIAVARFDKRGVGRSSRDFDHTAVTFEDFVADARAIVEQVQVHPDLGPTNVIGHSEGGLIALRIAADLDLDGLVLLAAAGRPLGELLREQLARQLDEATLAEVDRLLAALREGAPLGEVPDVLAPLFGPSTRNFVASVMDLDPLPLLRDLPPALPVAVVQGGTDVQIGRADAERLAAAREGASLVVLPRMNHVLKEEESAQWPQASYMDPSRPLATGLVPALTELLVTDPADEDAEGS